MARPRKQLEVTAGQAHYILERLHHTGHVTAAQIKRYLADLAQEIVDLERRIVHLRGTQMSNAPVTHSRQPRPRTAARRRDIAKKRTFTVTDKVLRSRELQGRYLPLLNKFSGRRRAAFARVAKEQGREAAIAQMEAALQSVK